MRKIDTVWAAAAVAVCCSSVGRDAAAGVDEAELWNGLLEAHAVNGGLDYEGLAADRATLDAYLASVAGADVSAMGDGERLAFWINAYNAGVARFVLERYPGIVSVRDVDGFFDELTYRVAGSAMSLDQVEGQARESGDPRVHFAVVCASTSCPDLLDEPFRGDEIDSQLSRLTRGFLADPTKGMRYDAGSGTLWLSSIFKWYAGDFTGGSTVVAFFSRGGVADWVLSQLPPEAAAEVSDHSQVRYLDYDWGLNDRPAEVQ